MKISWRDRQIGGFNLQNQHTLLQQEKIMLDFLANTGIKRWAWYGDNNGLKDICAELYELTNTDYQGIIIFGNQLFNLSTANLCQHIQSLTNSVDAAYLAINRYAIQCHDLSFELPDSIEASIDKIVEFCNQDFKRLHTFDEVTGKQMVAAHPLDCYGLCR